MYPVAMSVCKLSLIHQEGGLKICLQRYLNTLNEGSEEKEKVAGGKN